jgi:hypothetical protein
MRASQAAAFGRRVIELSPSERLLAEAQGHPFEFSFVLQDQHVSIVAYHSLTASWTPHLRNFWQPGAERARVHLRPPHLKHPACLARTRTPDAKFAPNPGNDAGPGDASASAPNST